MLKKNIFFVLFVSFVAFVACTSSSNEDTLTKVRRTGVIQATTVISPPFSIKDPTTRARSGSMIELMEEVARSFNARVNWHEATWGTAVTTLVSKRSDLVAAELYILEQRTKIVDFTKPLFYMGYGAVVRKDDFRFSNVIDVMELDKPEYTIVVAAGEAADSWLQDNFTQATVRQVNVESSDVTRFALEVISGRADAAFGGTDVIDLFVGGHSDNVVDLFAENPFGLTPAAWAGRKGDVSWLSAVQTKLDSLAEEGVIRRLEEKYAINVVHK